MPKLTINGIEIEVPPGTSILQAAEQLGIEIPRFCYHDRLSVPANCRMCLVEVAPGPPKPQASCALACADGMTVKTESDMAKKARKGVMEFLLINHPLDCPICDQGGECDLQDQAMAYGFDRSRYHENKRAVPDKNFGPLIKTSMNRCIQCTRCVRFGEEIAGVPDLGLLNRGEDVEISTFIGKAVGSELSANMIDVCPVGALTSKPYAFMARPWELTKTESVDVMDAVGSNIRVDSRGGEVLRILPRLHEDINEEWISDKTRYACDGLKVRRLDRPWLKVDGKLKEVSWDEALAAAATKLKGAQKIAALTGDLCAAEEMVALKDLMGALGVDHVSGLINGLRINTSSRSAYIMNTGIANLEKADAILLIGTNPRWEAAMVNARIRKAWRNNRAKIALVGPECDLNYPYTHIGNGPADLEALASGKHAFAAALKNAKNPVIIHGAGALEREDGEAVHALAASVAEALGVIRPDWNGFNVLHYNAAQVAALDLGLTTAKSADDKQAIDVFYLLGVDGAVVNALPRKAFVIYQGHHGDAGAHRADLILPGAAYTEKNGTYVNTEGRVQIGRKAADAPGQAREDWKILRALSGVLGKALPYDDLPQLRARIVREWPSFGAIDMQPAEQWKKLPAPIKGMKGDFKPVIENFYLTNSIARASKTMAQCVESFVENKQAAETEKEEAAE